MEVDQGLDGNLRLHVSLALCLLQLLDLCVVRVHVCGVVLVVVELHDLAADRRLEGAEVIFSKKDMVSTTPLEKDTWKVKAYMEGQAASPCSSRRMC